MKNGNIIDINDRLYEKTINDFLEEFSLEEYIHTYIDINTSHKEIQLLIQTTENSIFFIEQLIEMNFDSPNFVETIAIYNDTKHDMNMFLRTIKNSIKENQPLRLKPLNILWLLISLEIGGFVNSEKEFTTHWSEEDQEVLLALFNKIFKQAKIIYNVASPFDIPDILKCSRN